MSELNEVLMTDTDLTKDIDIKQDQSLLIRVQSAEESTINLNFTVQAQVNFRCLIFMDSRQKVTLNDTYHLSQDSQVIIAYSLLNDGESCCNSVYHLDGLNSDLHVLSASISSCKKQLNQFTHHHAADSKALIDNYGVVFQNGQCSMIVKNKIYKDIAGCNTRQNNRLLNFGDNGKSKILPILYIDNNEVAASHGCSIGQPDKEQIFYLTSRGLSYSQAVKLITLGYLMPITQIIDNQQINQLLKEEIEKKVEHSC